MKAFNLSQGALLETVPTRSGSSSWVLRGSGRARRGTASLFPRPRRNQINQAAKLALPDAADKRQAGLSQEGLQVSAGPVRAWKRKVIARPDVNTSEF